MGNLLSRALSVVLISTMMTSCQSSSFNGSSTKKPAKKDSPQVPSTPGSLTETFALEGGEKAPLDIVWTVDNSGSMADDIAQVRANFDAFVTSLDEVADVRLILLSETSSGSRFSLRLPSNAKSTDVEIDLPIGSWDALLIFAAGLCESSLKVSSPICGITPASGLKDIPMWASASPTRWPGNGTFISGAGRLKSHLRQESTKSFVFVTDDDSTSFSGKAFTKILKQEFGASLPRVYSFRGISIARGACMVSAVGSQYAEVEAATGGKAFDICDEDWSPAFKDLAASIKSSVKKTYALKEIPVGGTIKVSLGAVPLVESDFKLEGQTLTLLNEGVVQSAIERKDQLTVTYTPNKS